MSEETSVTLFDLIRTGWIITKPINEALSSFPEIEGDASRVAGHFNTTDNCRFYPTDDEGREIVRRIQSDAARARKP